MARFRQPWWAAVFGLALPLTFSFGAARDARPPAPRPEGAPSLAARIEAYIEPYVRTNNFSGVVLVTRDGQALFRKGYGLAVREFDVPVTPSTKFQVASVSKSFTAAAVLILAQQGRLRTSDPLKRFIPDYPNGDRITLHHLLTHTSGIPNVNAFPDYEAKSRFPHGLGEIVSWFKDMPLDFEPGTRYSYSNSNYNVIAFIIERVSGRSYGEFLAEAIFRPLEMKDTGHRGDARAVIPDLAGGYSPRGGEDVERAADLDWTIKTGNGSLYTTVDDLAKWDRALDGDRVLDADSRRKMFTDYIDGVGYGWFIRKGAHPSVAINGRAPGFSASLERFVEDKSCVIVLSNLYSSITHTISGDIAAIVYGEDRKPLVPSTPVEVGADEMARYVGRYRFGQDFSFSPGAPVEVRRDGRWLVLEVGGGGRTSYLIPLGGGRFLDRAYGGIVRFVTDGAGLAMALVWNFGQDFLAERTAAP
jgi:CubicO group peptidase (beta-lactamase class C family)